MAVPVWHPALTRAEADDIERVQKAAVKIIFGSYISYTEALHTLDMERLEVRRQNLCKTFATKASKHDKYSDWFWSSGANHDTRNKQNYISPWSRTSRYKNSPLPFLTELLQN